MAAKGQSQDRGYFIRTMSPGMWCLYKTARLSPSPFLFVLKKARQLNLLARGSLIRGKSKALRIGGTTLHTGNSLGQHFPGEWPCFCTIPPKRRHIDASVRVFAFFFVCPRKE